MKANKQAKKQRRTVFRVSILAVLLFAIVFALYSNFKDDKVIYRVGDKAGDFKLEQINPKNPLQSVQLSELKGKGVMLNFWATYCKPCEAEMPYMQKTYEKYQDQGIEIVAISLDSTELVIDRFMDKYGLTFPVLHDKGQVRDLYGIQPIPSSIFINSDGEIVEIVEGALSLERLEGYFEKIKPEKSN